MLDSVQEVERIAGLIKERKIDDLINFVSFRSNKERGTIRDNYGNTHNRKIVDDGNSNFSFNGKETGMALFYDPVEYDCLQLRKAMKGGGTNERTLIEIIGMRPNSVLKEIKAKYSLLLNRDLIKDVKSETSGSFGKLLLSLGECKRSENTTPDVAECKAGAVKLFEFGEKSFSADDSYLIKTFSERSPSELKQIYVEYFKLSKHTIISVINNEFSGNMRRLLKCIVYAIANPSEFYAKQINKAIKGGGTDDNRLIRICVSRDEIDMPEIKAHYKKLYKKEMMEDIKGDTSGDYQKLLVAGVRN